MYKLPLTSAGGSLSQAHLYPSYVSLLTSTLSASASYLDWTLEFPRRLGRLLSQQKISDKAMVRLSETIKPHSIATLVQNRTTILSGELPEVEKPHLATENQLDQLEVRNLSCYHADPSDGSSSSRQGVFDVSLPCLEVH